jgi:hypothetical protein
MTRTLLFLLVSLLVARRTTADDRRDRRSVTSPDGRFVVALRGANAAFPDTFTIQDAHGTTVLSSRDHPRFEHIAEFRPDYVSWSLDSEILAIAGGGGHDLETFIFVHRGNSFVAVTVPDLTDRRDNPFITPTKWLKGRRLTLAISGPHAGKANGYYYKGSATIRVSITPPACEVLYKKIIDHDDTKDA